MKAETELEALRRLASIVHTELSSDQLIISRPGASGAVCQILGRLFETSTIEAVNNHRQVWLDIGNKPYETIK
jgi:hypothetical protein